VSAYRNGGLLARNIGEVSSTGVAGCTLRREVAVVDGVKFYRFTVNPGMRTEYGTLWSEDEEMLLRAVYRRIGIRL
jgi:hypothetical protein